VGVATTQWVSGDVSDDDAVNRGDVTLGLFRASYSIRFKEADYRRGETSLYSFYDGVFTLPLLIGSTSLISLALAMTLVSLCIAVLAAISSMSHLAYKPLAMAIVSFTASVCALLGFCLFIWLYVQDMDNLLSSEMQELFPSFRTDAKLGYSFFLVVAGTAALCVGSIFSPIERMQQKRGENIQENKVKKTDAKEPWNVRITPDRYGEIIDSILLY
jgi:hypothetical protein